jgi:hypothetical protein
MTGGGGGGVYTGYDGLDMEPPKGLPLSGIFTPR